MIPVGAEVSMRRLRALTCLALVLVSLISLGCQSDKPVDSTSFVDTPQAQIIGARQVAQTSEGARVIATVDITNPNDIALPIARVDYTLTIEGKETFSFSETGNQTLTKKQVRRLELPAAFASDASLVGASYTLEGSASFEPPGELRRFLTDSGIPLPKVTFAGSGVIE